MNTQTAEHKDTEQMDMVEFLKKHKEGLSTTQTKTIIERLKALDPTFGQEIELAQHTWINNGNDVLTKMMEVVLDKLTKNPEKVYLKDIPALGTFIRDSINLKFGLPTSHTKSSREGGVNGKDSLTEEQLDKKIDDLKKFLSYPLEADSPKKAIPETIDMDSLNSVGGAENAENRESEYSI